MILIIIFMVIAALAFTPLGVVTDYYVFLEEVSIDVPNTLVEKYPETREFRLEIYNEDSENPEYITCYVEDDYTYQHYKVGKPVNLKYVKLIRKSNGKVEDHYYYIE